MAQYPQPDDRSSDVFNESDFLTTPDELAEAGIENKFVKLAGDFMSGALYSPAISTDTLSFPTGNQSQPFTDVLRELVDTVATRTQHIWVNASNTTEVATLCVGTLQFIDDGNQTQTKAFSDSDKNTLDDTKSKTTQLAYDAGLLKTTVTNTLHASTLTCDNINTSHLSGTTSSLQHQINTLNGNTAYIASYQLAGAPPTTVISGHLDSNFLTLYDGFGSTGRVTFPNGSTQSTAFTTEDRTKMNQLTINPTETTVNQLKFSDDNSVQRTGFTAFFKSLLLSNQANVAALQTKTVNISGGTGSVTSVLGALYTSIIDLAGQINFPDGTVQTSAFKNLPITHPERSTTTYHDISLGLPSTFGSGFLSDTVLHTIKIIGPGLHTINCGMDVKNINNLSRLKYRLRAAGQPSSPWVGINLTDSSDSWENFHFPLTWSFSVVNTTTVSVETEYDFRPHPSLTSMFYCQVITLF